jgi:hypothetical protein
MALSGPQSTGSWETPKEEGTALVSGGTSYKKFQRLDNWRKTK